MASENDKNLSILKNKRVLLAEDNELNCEIAEAILVDAGMIIDKAKNGRECIEKYEQSSAGYYSLILMDIQMPQMDGYEAAKYIRNLPDRNMSTISIIAMTANAFDEDRIAAEDAGMNGHISKPFSKKKDVQCD